MKTLNTAIEAATKAGEIIREHFTRLSPNEIHQKGLNDPVTDIDKSAENVIISLIKGIFPDHGILSEESEPIPGASDHTWIIDPIDGTNNYIRHVPWVAVSIAHAVGHEIIEGIVYNPISNLLFSAQKGSGAFLNDRKISVSKVNDLSEAMILLERSPRAKDKEELYYNQLASLSKELRGTRRTGAAALDICYVASGNFDLFWGVGLKPWDIAAGSIILSEAGGRMIPATNDSFPDTPEHVLASNENIFSTYSDFMNSIIR